MTHNASDLSPTVAMAAPTPLTPADLAHWSVPRRPSTRWLKSRDPYTPSDDVPPHIIWQWRVIKIIDADLAWANWWQAADYQTLHLVLPLSDLYGDHVSFTPSGQGLQVSGTSTEVSRLYRDAALGDEDSWIRQFQAAFAELLRNIMGATADHLDIAPPPPLPNLTSTKRGLA